MKEGIILGLIVMIIGGVLFGIGYREYYYVGKNFTYPSICTRISPAVISYAEQRNGLYLEYGFNVTVDRFPHKIYNLIVLEEPAWESKYNLTVIDNIYSKPFFCFSDSTYVTITYDEAAEVVMWLGLSLIFIGSLSMALLIIYNGIKMFNQD